MLSMQKLVYLIVAAALGTLTCLPFVSSSPEHAEATITYLQDNDKAQEMTPELSSKIALHGFLFWDSMGFLMPVAILTMRMSNKEENARRLKLNFHIHATLQTLSVLLATTGAIISIRDFENSFNNNHQRIGLALYFVMWLPALTGILRPQRGKKGRSFWYLVHWFVGSTVSLLGVINIYTGLQAYQKRTFGSSRVWTIIFTIEIAFVGFLYLLQGKRDYIQQEGTSLSNEPVQSADQESAFRDKQKGTSAEPC